MADFISREKEFRKLNEQLDEEFKRSTLNKIEKFSESPIEPRRTPFRDRSCEHQNITNSMDNDRFATYTKSKPYCTSWMKKHGGGDFISPPKPPLQRNTKDTYGNSFNKHITKPSEANSPAEVINTSTYRKQQPKIRSIGESHQRTGGSTVAVNGTFSTRMTPASPAVPITVNFRNEKFSTSTSLDNIIKENLEKLGESNAEENYDLYPTSTRTDRKSEMSSHVLDSKSIEGKNVKKFVNTNGLIRFLKTKISLLEENQGQIIKDMEQQKEAFETSNDRLKSMQQQRDKINFRNSALSEQVEKLTAQLGEVNLRSKEQSYDTLAQHKELETVKRELRLLKITHKCLETRHMRTKEELENTLKSEAKLKNNERELKESWRREMDAKDNEIKHLKKQRSDLFNAYKRQLHLIDNLRHQSICMEQAKMIDFCEKEFSKVLEWNLKP